MKTFIVGRRAPNTSRQATHHHMLHVHGPMVVNAPPDAGPLPSPYVQNHIVDGLYPVEILSFPREIDFVTEINFSDSETMKSAMSTEYYREHLKRDEVNFVDHSSVMILPVTETRCHPGQSAPFKVLIFVLHGEDHATIPMRFAGLAAGRRHNVHRIMDQSDNCTFVLEGWASSAENALNWAKHLFSKGIIALASSYYTNKMILNIIRTNE